MRTVKEISELTGISVRTLHYYDEIGLLKPTQKSDAGYRLYDDRALEILQQILFFREFDIPLKEIKAVLENPALERNQILQMQRKMLVAKKERMEHLIASIDDILKGENKMDFAIFSKTEVEEMFQTMFEHMPDNMKELAVKEFGSIEEWKKHYIKTVSSEEMQKGYAKVVEWYGGKEQFLSVANNPISKEAAESYNQQFDNLLYKLAAKKVCSPDSSEVRELVSEYGFLMKQLSQIKKEHGLMVAQAQYYRTVIPVTEMMIHLMQDEAHDYGELALRQNKILNNMLGCEIDFLIKGLDPKTRSIVASRKEAMLKKRQIFYLDKDASGMPKVYEDRIVQARVIAVAEKVVRAEIFGVETSILARDLSFDWMGDARERFQVGDHILVRILDVRADSPEQVIVHADVKSVEGNTSKENMKKCKIQGKYAGTVEDIHKGTVFVRLSIGVNAIAHSCYDNRTVGKKDQVSFVVTHIDEERNVALGIITRIIKQTI